MKRILFLLFVIMGSVGKHSAQIINTVVGGGASGYGGDNGLGTSAVLNKPNDMVFDAFCNMYVADGGNNRIRIINTDGIIRTIAGTGDSTFGGDGGQATDAQLNYPLGITFDNEGNYYIPDCFNHRIRKVNNAGVITTVAGNGFGAGSSGIGGYSGDGGQATDAQLYQPSKIAFDAAGNMYIPDWGNNRIRMVNAAGIITTIAGTGKAGYSGDGGLASKAKLNLPNEVLFDGLGNLYIVDQTNNRIRMVNTAGLIKTIAGNGKAGYSGDGGPAVKAALNMPAEICFDGSGNLYIADANNHRIRMVSPDGIITTVSGTGNPGFGGDGGQANAADLYYPTGVTLDVAENLYIADWTNNRIRKVNINGINAVSEGLCNGAVTARQPMGINRLTNGNNVSVYPNPTSGFFTIEQSLLGNQMKGTIVQIYDVNSKLVSSQSMGNKINIDANNFIDGVYNICIISNDGVINKRILIAR